MCFGQMTPLANNMPIPPRRSNELWGAAHVEICRESVRWIGLPRVKVTSQQPSIALRGTQRGINY
jgi:hypothetical protein